MSLLHLAYVIARRRLLANWQLELVMLLGILLAVALLSSSVVFSDLLAEAALRRALNEATPEQVNIWVRTFNDLDDPAVQGRAAKYRTAVELVEQRIAPRLADWTDGYNQLYETSTFYFAGHPHLELDDQIRPRGKIQHMTGLARPGKTELLRGRWPGASSGSGPVEVALDRTGAQLLELDTGDVITVLPATGDKSPKTMDVVVVGVFDRTNPADSFWYGFEKDFSYQDERWTIVPLFTSEEALTQRVGQAFAGMHTNTTWVFGLDRPAVQAGEVDDIHAALRQVRAEVVTRLDNGSISVKLDRVLREYSEQLTLARIPLLLMVLLVTGILAYYLALVAGLVVRSRGTEIAMLRSRGSTPFQIGMLVFVEGLLLAIPAVFLGTLSSPLVAKTLGGWFFPVEGRPGLWRFVAGRPAGHWRRAVGGERPHRIHSDSRPPGHRRTPARRRASIHRARPASLLPGHPAAGPHRRDVVADTKPRVFPGGPHRLPRVDHRLLPAAGSDSGTAGPGAAGLAVLPPAGGNRGPADRADRAGLAGAGTPPRFP